jgi:hypothetical protein
MSTRSSAALQRDDRPPRKGWAPGKYLRRCGGCAESFIGDKRAGECARCAYADCPNLMGVSSILPPSHPTGDLFAASQQAEHHRHLLHGVLQLSQGVAGVAKLGERFEHRGTLVTQIAIAPPGSPAGDMKIVYNRELGESLADLVLAAIEIARTSPFGPLDLDAALDARVRERVQAAEQRGIPL